MEQPHSATHAKPVTVAISRERGAGGRAIAEEVAKKLDWPLYDRDLVDKIAEDSGVRTELLDQLDERRPNWIGEVFHGFSDEKQMSGAGYAVRLHRVLLALSYHGDCVIMGRGAAQLLPANRTVRVAIVAPRPHRIERLSQTLGSEHLAASHADETDKHRVEFVRQYYHKDPLNLDDYDAVFDTSVMSHDECVEQLIAAIHAKRGTQEPNAT